MKKNFPGNGKFQNPKFPGKFSVPTSREETFTLTMVIETFANLQSMVEFYSPFICVFNFCELVAYIIYLLIKICDMKVVVAYLFLMK